MSYRTLMHLGPLLLAWALFGCGAPTEKPEEFEIVALAVSPEDVLLFVGQTHSFEVTATLEDGSRRVLTEGVTWTSATPAVATFSAPGTITAHAAGEVRLEASAGGHTASASAMVAQGGALSALSVTPDHLTFPTASAFGPIPVVSAVLEDGSSLDVSRFVTWASSDEDLLLLPTGELVGLSAGNMTLTASVQGRSTEVSVDVTGSSIGTMRFSQKRYGLAPIVGAKGTFRVEALLSNGSVAYLTSMCSYRVTGGAVRLAEPGAFEVVEVSPDTDSGAGISAALGRWEVEAEVTIGPKRLFVANHGDGTLLSFALPFGAGGDVAPTQAIFGAATGLVEPTGVFFDAVHDELWVSDESTEGVTVFPGAPGIGGDLPPSRTFQGQSHGREVAFDAQRDRLYVVNDARSGINVFDAPREAHGRPAVARRIASQSNVRDLVLDEANDRLFIAVSRRIEIVNAASADDERPEDRRFLTPEGFNDFRTLAIDVERQRLYVGLMTGEIVVLTDLGTASGSVKPAAVFRLPRPARDPRGLMHDGETDTLYVAIGTGEASRLHAYENVRALEGQVSPEPVATIQGPRSLLWEPTGLSLGW